MKIVGFIAEESLGDFITIITRPVLSREVVEEFVKLAPIPEDRRAEEAEGQLIIHRQVMYSLASRYPDQKVAEVLSEFLTKAEEKLRKRRASEERKMRKELHELQHYLGVEPYIINEDGNLVPKTSSD